jgi:hypothetical protein
LLQYISIVVPIHLRGVLEPRFEMGAWRDFWTAGEERSRVLSLAEVKAEIASHRALVRAMLEPLSDAVFREPYAMFGMTFTRGAWMVNLVLSHYVAYRMQLFQYLKASGQTELNTMNLWMGIDAPMTPPV